MTAERVVIDPDLAPLIPTYLENLGAFADGLEAAIAGADLGEVRAIAHQLTGTGTAYGFRPVSAWGTALDRAAVGGDLAAIADHLGALRAYLGRIEVVYGP